MSLSSVTMTSERHATWRARWRIAGASLGLALLVLGLALHDPAWRLWDLWLNSFEYGHGLVVIPVTVYLLWLRRDALLAQIPAPDWRGVVVTAVLMAAWFASRILGVVLGEQIALVLLVLSVTLSVAGPRVARIAAPPVLYVLFAVPLWTYLSPVMQTITAEVSASMARALGVPIYLEGLYMTIPDGRFLVAETCSGLRYLLAAMSLGGFYALLNLHRSWARWAILLFSAVLGVLFNWVRVVGIVLIGHHSHMQSPIVGDHVTFGWVLFIVVVVATLAVGRLLERLEGPLPAPPSVAAGSAPPARRFVAAAVLVAAVLVLPAVTAGELLRVDRDVPPVALPDTFGDGAWTREPFPDDSRWRPSFQGAQSEPLARYRHAAHPEAVDVFVAYYPVQRQDAEAVNEGNRLFAPQHWRRYSQEVVPSRIEPAPGLSMAEYRLVRRHSNLRRLVWWSYWVDARFTPDPVTAKWFQLRAALTGRSPAAVLVLSTESIGDDESARARLAAFAASAREGLVAELERVARLR